MTVHKNPSRVLMAVSLWQPWASLLALGIKRCETRGRPLPRHYNGRVLAVHAALKCPPLESFGYRLHAICVREFGTYWYEELPRGKIVGSVRMRHSCETRKRGEYSNLYDFPISDDEIVMGDWTDGRFFWRAEEARLMTLPISMSGAQGFFQVPDRVAVQVLLTR